MGKKSAGLIIWGELVPVDVLADRVLHLGEDEVDAALVEGGLEIVQRVRGGGVDVGDRFRCDDDPSRGGSVNEGLFRSKSASPFSLPSIPLGKTPGSPTFGSSLHIVLRGVSRQVI